MKITEKLKERGTGLNEYDTSTFTYNTKELTCTVRG